MSLSKQLYKHNSQKINYLNFLFFLIASLISIFILDVSLNLTGTTLVLLSFSLSLLFITLILFKPKLWLYSIVLFSGLFSSTTGGGISTLDVVFLIYLNVFLYLWFIWQIFVVKDKLIESKTDWILVAFFVLTLFTLINVFVENTLLLEWIREYSLISLILLYFPMKKYLQSNKEIITLLVLFAVTILFTDLLQFYIYKEILSNITYAYQAGTTIRNNLQFFVLGITFSCIFIFYQKKSLYRLLLAIFLILTLGALASTFARIFWAAAAVNVSLIFILLNMKEKVKFIAYFFLSLIVAYLVASLFFGDIFKFIIFALESRLESTSKGTTDISALSRFEEWKVVISKIKESPFIGNGFGSTFTFRNPITGANNYTSVIHNSFLHFPYRIGIPLSIMYFSVFIIIFFKSLYYSIKIKVDLFYKILMICVTLSIISLFITGMFTMTFIIRDALISNAALLFLVYYAEVNYKNRVLN